AVNGPAGLAFGAYNNTAVSGGQTTQSNPYFGGIDEFALYAKKLDEATILAHYKNGTNSARATAYADMVKADGPVEYLQFDELPPQSNTLINMGDLRNNASLDINNKVQLNAPSPLQGEWRDHSIASHRRAGAGTRANMPFHVENNPTEDQPFSVELWVRAQLDRITPGAAVINNRKAAGNRSGWVIFQRAPNDTYSTQSGYERVGYDFRMYTGSGSSGGADIATLVPYTVGEWQHLVFTWQPDFDTGNGNWSGTLTAYVNGSPILPGDDPTATNMVTGVYHANTDPTDDGTNPADLAIGSYNAASNWGQEFDGDIDEVAIYRNWALTPDQVAAHYAAGTNSHPSTIGVAPSVVEAGNDVTNYASLVFSAPYQGTVASGIGGEKERMGPPTYLRFNDTPPYPTANSGSAGPTADAVAEGSATLYAPGVTGAGFPAPNNAVAFDGTNTWLSLLSVPSLEFSGMVTLEAWVLPSSTQGDVAKIISHGPALLSLYQPDVVETNGSIFTSPEVFLQIDGAGANYTVGSSDGTNSFTATAAVPAADLTANQWVHLAGTYDGTNWKLYRNGTLIATSAAATGALPVPNGDWAIGSTGEGWADIFNGSIDEPAIYNKALSAAQITAHYTASTTGGGSDVTLAQPTHTDTTITLSWTGGTGKFLIQKKTDIGAASWTNVATTTANSITLPMSGATGFYRVQSNYTGPDIP
ncbi:MAG TPA: LamG domain-containing protein, partial [Verrucomicrobiae bacterium]